MIVAGHALEVVHPPGYPLFKLLAHLFSWLPIASVTWCVNLLPAVYAVTAEVFAVHGLFVAVAFLLAPRWSRAHDAGTARLLAILRRDYGTLRRVVLEDVREAHHRRA